MRDGIERAFGPRRGEPGSPLLEALILFAAFYLVSYLPLGTQAGLLSIERHLGILAICLPRALLVLYIMGSDEGFSSFGLRRIAPKDAALGMVCAAGAAALAALCALAFSALGVKNPLLGVSGPASPTAAARAALLALVLASSIATGYCEELFFRSYLMRRLGQAGLPPLWAGIASSLVFGGAHGDQGAVGVATGFLLGLFFAWRWSSSRDLHEIALGHGLYDAAVYVFVLYS